MIYQRDARWKCAADNPCLRFGFGDPLRERLCVAGLTACRPAALLQVLCNNGPGDRVEVLCHPQVWGGYSSMNHELHPMMDYIGLNRLADRTTNLRTKGLPNCGSGEVERADNAKHTYIADIHKK